MKNFCQKTVLITGATGLIGSHIVDALMQMENVRVIALSRNEKKLKKGFREYIKNPDFRYIAQNITDKLCIAEKVDYIFHAAGPMEGKIIKNQPIDVINPNIIGTMNCLEFLKEQKEKKKYKGRMVLFSSVTVYGNNTETDITLQETDTQVTESLDSAGAAYSQSKRISEIIAQAYHKQFHIDIVIARFSTVYGSTRFIPDTAFFEFVKKAVAGENIILNTSGQPRRDNIYIDDAVSGVLTICTHGRSGEVYNISSNGDMDNYASIDEIAEKIAEVVNTAEDMPSVSVSFLSKKIETRKAGLRLDNRKLKQLGWTVHTGLKAGIEKTVCEIMHNMAVEKTEFHNR